METTTLTNLIQAYENAEEEFKATNYWKSYEKDTLDTIRRIDINQLRSGKHPVLATFGFNDVRYHYHPNLVFWKKAILKLIHRIIFMNKPILPYQLQISDFPEMAYHHCELMADLTNSVPIKNIEVSTFGNPQDIFEINGNKYTMQFLNFYIRYCFANKWISFKGDEIIVELGSGSGYQIEILKKIYPNITVLCLDLPGQIYLCEQYLAQALKDVNITGTDETLNWTDLSGIKKGGIYFFGNWKFPILQKFKFDVFWNAASFGEMEPDIVENYLSFLKGNARWIYLLQARHGKETSGKSKVFIPITLDDYKRLLPGYVLADEQNAWFAHRRLSESGGYFQGVWETKN